MMLGLQRGALAVSGSLLEPPRAGTCEASRSGYSPEHHPKVTRPSTAAKTCQRMVEAESRAKALVVLSAADLPRSAGEQFGAGVIISVRSSPSMW